MRRRDWAPEGVSQDLPGGEVALQNSFSFFEADADFEAYIAEGMSLVEEARLLLIHSLAARFQSQCVHAGKRAGTQASSAVHPTATHSRVSIGLAFRSESIALSEEGAQALMRSARSAGKRAPASAHTHAVSVPAGRRQACRRDRLTLPHHRGSHGGSALSHALRAAARTERQSA